MSRNGANKYTKEEDDLIRSLYPKYDEEYIAKQLGRTQEAIRYRRLKLGIYKPSKSTLSEEQIERIEYLLKKEVTAYQISNRIPGVSVPMVYTVRDRMFDNISKNRPVYAIEPIKSFVAMGQTAAYWSNEQEIMDSFDPEYSFTYPKLDRELAWHNYETGQTNKIMSKLK
jgi:hypothetical protein